MAVMAVMGSLVMFEPKVIFFRRLPAKRRARIDRGGRGEQEYDVRLFGFLTFLEVTWLGKGKHHG